MSNYQDSLFSEEEITGQKNLFSDIENDDNQKASEPVTCLGMTFANDDERRSYFRAELRKKLPELRHIEGFPIGSDDDIINLSDPPYYTACPNPWLNDFIAQWEEEKKELQREGKRKADFEVKEPYASDVSEGKNNPIYMAHAYHTKCPHPAIMRYILHYTQPGDIVFDGFAGTGMTGVAANLCGSKVDVDALNENNVTIGVRHGICSDLSPAASLIAASYTIPFDSISFRKKALSVLNQVEEEFGWMFKVKERDIHHNINFTVWSDVLSCSNCNAELVFWDEAVDLEKEVISHDIKCPFCGYVAQKRNMQKHFESYYDSNLEEVQYKNKKVPVLINYTSNGKRVERCIIPDDVELINKTETLKSSCHLIKLKDGYNTSQPIRSNGIKYIHQFYTQRVLIYLNKVYELVKGDVELTAWFTSISLIASKLYSFRLNRKNGIMKGTLYVPSLTTECNPYNLLKGKIEDFVKANYQYRGNGVSSLLSATNLEMIHSNSVDYIFIDPPFGANIMYSEVSSIWEGWLGLLTNDSNEAIVNPVKKKDIFEYQRLMNLSFQEFYRILKPGKWLTIEFSNTSASVWNSIQNSLQGVGFIIANITALDKQQGSIKAVTTTTAVKQDLVITCYKPSDELTEKFKTSQELAMNVWDFVEEHLCHLTVHLKKGNKTTDVEERSPKILFDRVVSYYVQHGYPVPIDAADFQHGLRERFVERDGMFFTAEQSLEYDTKRAQTEGYEAAQSMFVGSEAEGIEWLKRELVEPKTYQDLQPQWMQALVQTKKGDNLPELKQILEENFLKDNDGRWYKPDPEKEADLEKVRARELARNFKAYVELASTPKGKIKEARLEALRYGFRECYNEKDFATIVKVAQRLPEALVMEDEVLLEFYQIAINHV